MMRYISLGKMEVAGVAILALFAGGLAAAQTGERDGVGKTGIRARVDTGLSGSNGAQAGAETKQVSPDHVFTLVGAGDIAGCKAIEGARATAKLIDQIPGTVFAAGDLVYEHGNAEEFRDCYGPTWGRFKRRTRPTLGNHEYGLGDAADYFQYWGAQAGPVGKGYYSYDLGIWHIVALNTNCDAPALGGCGAGSPQEVWLREDLRQHANACIVAYGHHALFSSGVFARHAIHSELNGFGRIFTRRMRT